MIKRIVEVGSAAYLHLRDNQLVIERKEEPEAQVPIEDLGVLILDSTAITITQALIAACASANVTVVISNEKHLPTALLQPYEGNYVQTKIIAAQIELHDSTRKKLWNEIVKAKIEAQAKMLDAATGQGHLVSIFAKRIKGADENNLEGQAARVYWPALFGKGFIRNPDLDGINTLLNYGYAIIRAATARAIAGTGLNPSIGIHHRNQYNNLVLADDLMEPIRPIVDKIVYEISLESDDIELNRSTRSRLLGTLSMTVSIADRTYPLLTAIQLYAASMRKVMCKEANELEIPIL